MLLCVDVPFGKARPREHTHTLLVFFLYGGFVVVDVCLAYDDCSNYVVWLKAMQVFDGGLSCSYCKRLVSIRDLHSSRLGLVCCECWKALMLGSLWKVGHENLNV